MIFTARNEYALSCGNVQRLEIEKKGKVELYKEHNMYHVKLICGELKEWSCFENLKDARKDFELKTKKLEALEVQL